MATENNWFESMLITPAKAAAPVVLLSCGHMGSSGAYECLRCATLSAQEKALATMQAALPAAPLPEGTDLYYCTTCRRTYLHNRTRPLYLVPMGDRNQRADWLDFHAMMRYLENVADARLPLAIRQHQFPAPFHSPCGHSVGNEWWNHIRKMN